MEWREEGIVLGVRRQGETSVVAEVMTRSRGRHLGLVRGGRSRRLQPVLQPGNTVDATWRARLDEHLGFMTVEPVHLRAARLMESAVGLYGIQLLAAHLRLLPERDAHPRLFDTLALIVEHLDDPVAAGSLILRFEIALLEELGFGLDLETCAATGGRDDLVYVSPKSGRAVSRDAGEPWRDRLLPLPAFLKGDVSPASADVAEGFRMTGFFLARHVWEPRAIKEPDARVGTLGVIARSRASAEG
ncbi:DNA repair protein RecO [Aureimonas phyllosphaerae]|uniref:DNA repair protein RecO n=1 Tax=Aureimonas phyllosphaerae TaxID=1166078 RepID=A0A7W6BM66_9HYPH|nr:DNA repair protein RecO [Aureimonas phyllosphaerae]MBB3934553.1 DNA repair protein RecO (recombination protein O) [Aureimonas phyllosphaerae]MBB3958231.1 DNA repair protein RecO (recombination protein O) [Aureimonas phyllosphaerae]SFE93959.1 DNA replication and repair protein RecO [Aureimonas phyllosphaerae]